LPSLQLRNYLVRRFGAHTEDRRDRQPLLSNSNN
jgi:hypothetical protein